MEIVKSKTDAIQNLLEITEAKATANHIYWMLYNRCECEYRIVDANFVIFKFEKYCLFTVTIDNVFYFEKVENVTEEDLVSAASLAEIEELDEVFFENFIKSDTLLEFEHNSIQTGVLLKFEHSINLVPNRRKKFQIHPAQMTILKEIFQDKIEFEIIGEPFDYHRMYEFLVPTDLEWNILYYMRKWNYKEIRD